MTDAAIAKAATPASRPGAAALRKEALAAPNSGIVEVFDYGRGKPGLIPMWVGEGDLPTPSFIGDAAAQALAAGETFYGHQGGHPALRGAIAAYIARIYGRPNADDPSRYFVTVGAMHALQIAVRIVAGEGDEVVVPTPAWPNFRGALTVAGATTVEVPMTFAEAPDRSSAWSLDLDRLHAALGPRTRAICINSPANPTGWTATHDEISAILELARRHGLWIIADEIYGRIVFDGDRAPSFRDVMADGDRIMFVQTFSKNWAMSGWRIGWLEVPSELGPIVENLVQYSTSGVPVFLQRGAIAALEQGEPFLADQFARIGRSRDLLCDGLAAEAKVRYARPAGGFYVFCAIDGEPDSRALALRLVDEAGVGVAPGSAFGAAGAGFLRLCFARDPAQVAEAIGRLRLWLNR